MSEMSEEYVWLLKGDNAYKQYKAKGWNTIISIMTELEEVYFCLAKNKQFVTEEEKIKLVAPVCLNNTEYKDYIVSFEQDSDFGFIWKDKRCFSVSNQMISDLLNSSMHFYNDELHKVIESPQALFNENNVKVKSSSVLSIIIMAMVKVQCTLLWLQRMC